MPPLVWWGDADPEARMTDVDRLLFLALDAYEADLCSCGHPRSEAWSPEHDPADPFHVAHYETGAPFRCFSCAERARGEKAYAKTHGEERMAGAYFVTELVPNPRLGLALAQQAPSDPEGAHAGQ